MINLFKFCRPFLAPQAKEKDVEVDKTLNAYYTNELLALTDEATLKRFFERNYRSEIKIKSGVTWYRQITKTGVTHKMVYEIMAPSMLRAVFKHYPQSDL